MASDSEQRECPSCGKAVAVPARLLGRTVRCPGCKTTFVAEDDVEVAELAEEVDERPGARRRAYDDEDDDLPLPRRRPRDDDYDRPRRSSMRLKREWPPGKLRNFVIASVLVFLGLVILICGVIWIRKVGPVFATLGVMFLLGGLGLLIYAFSQ